MALSNRQRLISEIVRQQGPISGEHIAQQLHVTRAALRSDLAILVMGGILDARPKVGYFYTGKNTLGLIEDEISSLTVKAIQSMPVAKLSTSSVYDCIVTMFTEDVGTVCIIGEDGLLEGVVSRKDLLRTAVNAQNGLKDLPVIMVMTPVTKVITVTEDEPVFSAACKLIDNEIDCLPVVRQIEQGPHAYEVVGRVTKTNFTRLLVDLSRGKGGSYHE